MSEKEKNRIQQFFEFYNEITKMKKCEMSILKKGQGHYAAWNSIFRYFKID